MRLQPLDDRIVILAEPDNTERVVNGIHLPASTEQDESHTAEVLAIGPGHVTEDGTLIPNPIKVGDTIVYNKYGGQNLTLDSIDYHVLRATEVVAIITPPGESSDGEA